MGPERPFVHYDKLPMKPDRLPQQFFREAAMAQRRCAGCGASGLFQAHHVVYEQHLRQIGEPKFSPRNALRLCAYCHRRHHNRLQTLPLTALTDENIAYAAEVLRERAYDYLTRYYDGEDPRVSEFLCREQWYEHATGR